VQTKCPHKGHHISFAIPKNAEDNANVLLDKINISELHNKNKS
jgi:hypothetical protein